MHFVIGGAYNGKREWVKKQLTENQILMLNKPLGNEPLSSFKVIVKSDLECWILDECDKGKGEETLLQLWENELKNLLEWEQQDKDRSLFIIGTDQSKGIVPMDRAERKARDLLGWCHQHTAKKAEHVTRIWYGIAQELK
ncbi:bifunctional adenosylcobinamide kinase/adenosylcobinamide-phosphate guanylyltransferase [Jeotgalibacillus proteolyticus]|uniref:Uncharacterized protein n=1 Tax=Jeotgalibacillus proteolyticus TaxID=2082395 RepID=A0A2S5G9I5_9BACL|nr:bifunctional adenosylcobinamide kinase/adenosylcobinamide-phosphate guanylyltransferase [Jeotgalibacillus proteolyticus]PPA69660.1 hypothetical protein C4B60_14040 [Jeotgalibacillus proteolyticus]